MFGEKMLKGMLAQLGPEHYKSAGISMWNEVKKGLMNVLEEAKQTRQEGEKYVGFITLPRMVETEHGETEAHYAFVVYMDENYNVVRRGETPYYIDGVVSEADFVSLFGRLIG